MDRLINRVITIDRLVHILQRQLQIFELHEARAASASPSNLTLTLGAPPAANVPHALSEQLEDSTKVWESLVLGCSRFLHVGGRIAITGCVMFFVIALMMSSRRRQGWQVWLRR